MEKNEQEAKKEILAKNGSKKAGILDQARLRPLDTSQRLFLNGNIIKTLIKLKSFELSESTLRYVSIQRLLS